MKTRIASIVAIAALVVGVVMAQDYPNRAGAGTSVKVTGTIVSVTADSVVIDTDSGRLGFKMDASTMKPDTQSLQPGVLIEVTEASGSAGGAPMASKITLAVATPKPESYSSSSPSTANTPTTNQESGTVQGRQMPATASPLPFVALLGALALAGYGFVRARRRANQDT